MSEIKSIEEQERVAESARTRFANIMFGTAGGAILFGLVAKVSGAFIESASAAYAAGTLFSSAGFLPMLGLVTIAALGVASIYMGATYLAKSISIDQENQARKTAEACNGKMATVELPVQEPSKFGPIPSATLNQPAEETASAPPAKQWAASVVSANAKAPEQSWASHVAQPDAGAAVTLH